MSTPLPRQIAILIENYNNDVRSAIKDDIGPVQLLALMGSICQSTLSCIEPAAQRKRVWDAVCQIMGEKFEAGEV